MRWGASSIAGGSSVAIGGSSDHDLNRSSNSHNSTTFNQPSSHQQGLSSSSTVSSSRRVLVVGDHAVGKSLLIQLLASASVSATGKSELPKQRLQPTIGCHVTGMAMGGANRSVEFVEMGGDRSMLLEARSSCYSNIDGVIFVYNAQNMASVIELHHWFRELQLMGLVGSPGAKQHMLIGTLLPKSGRSVANDVSGLLDAIADPSTRSFVDPRAASLQKLLAKLLAIWALWQRVLLVALGLVLFGLNQQVVEFTQPSVKQTLETIKNDEGCSGVLEGCPMDDAAVFSLESEEIRYFLGSI